MSYSKRILFGDDPADDPIRTAIAIAAARTVDEFPCKVPVRRKNRHGSTPWWDPFWPNSLNKAGKELGSDVIRVNDQICTRTPDEAARLKAAAEVLWEKAHADFAQLRAKRR